MANEKPSLENIGSIAQAMKFQIRKGKQWDLMSAASMEALDQICTAIAQIVSGDQPHWETIVSYAQAAQPAPTLEIEREMRRLVREIPKANADG